MDDRTNIRMIQCSSVGKSRTQTKWKSNFYFSNKTKKKPSKEKSSNYKKKKQWWCKIIRKEN